MSDKLAECIVCDTETEKAWCSSCVAQENNRHVEQFELLMMRHERLEYQVNAVLKSLEGLPDNALGMTKTQDGRYEWPRKGEIHWRLMIGLGR